MSRVVVGYRVKLSDGRYVAAIALLAGQRARFVVRRPNDKPEPGSRRFAQELTKAYNAQHKGARVVRVTLPHPDNIVRDNTKRLEKIERLLDVVVRALTVPT